MTIREAIESDIEAIAELEAAYAEEMRDLAPDQFRELEYPLSLEQLKRQLEDDKVKMFVAEEDTELAGYLSATIGSTGTVSGAIEQEGKLCDIYIRPEHRGFGLTSSLCDAAREWFRSCDCVWETLTVHDVNPAKEIYVKWGFQVYSVNMRRRLKDG